MRETPGLMMGRNDIRRVMEWREPALKAAERRGFWKGVVTIVIAAALWGLLWLTMAAL